MGQFEALRRTAFEARQMVILKLHSHSFSAQKQKARPKLAVVDCLSSHCELPIGFVGATGQKPHLPIGMPIDEPQPALL